MKYLIALLLFVGVCAHANSASNLIHKAGFEETYQRYPSPYGMIQILRKIYPNLGNAKYHECLSVGKKSAPATGAIDPLQGTALEEVPGALFYPYFENCVRDIGSVVMGNGVDARKNAEIILGEELAQELNDYIASCSTIPLSYTTFCNADLNLAYGSFWSYLPFEKIPAEMQSKMMGAFIDYLIGPEAALRQLKMIGDENVFGRELNSSADLSDMLTAAMKQLTSDDKKLTARQVYAEIAILLRLGPALKH